MRVDRRRTQSVAGNRAAASDALRRSASLFENLP